MNYKKIVSILTLASMLLSSTTSAYASSINNGYGGVNNQSKAIVKKVDNPNKKDVFVSKTFDAKVTNSDEVVKFLNSSSADLAGEKNSFAVNSVEKDDLGFTHYRTIMTKDGVPVLGSEVNVHVDNKGKVYAVNGNMQVQVPDKKWSSLNNSSEDKAKQVALSLVNAKLLLVQDASQAKVVDSPKLYLYEYNGEFKLVYLVKVAAYEEKQPVNYEVYVGAEDGQVVNSKSYTENIVGKGTDLSGKSVAINLTAQNGKYYMIDTTKLSNGAIRTYDMNNITESNYSYYANRGVFKGTLIGGTSTTFNTERTKAAVSAQVNVGKVLDYYKTEFNRNGIDGKGSDVKIGVHLDKNYDNAFWDGTINAMLFGDGDGKEFSSLAAALDVIGHEMTHGVVQYTSNLNYENQPGALNEALADIMGEAAENKANDWLMGEDVFTPGIAGDGLRNFADPGNVKYAQPSNYSQYPGDEANPTRDNDYGGVHNYSGIILKAAYNIGSKIGKKEMGKLFYRANYYFTSTTTFGQARKAALQAATDLYGLNSTNYKIVQSAFDSVGITSTVK